MAHADELFAGQETQLRKFSDTAGVFRMKDREPLRDALEEFERRFPQLLLAVHLRGALDPALLRQFGFWMLNRVEFTDADPERSNATAILITIDVDSKLAAINYGYALMPYLSEESTFEALSAGHPFLLQGNYLGGLKMVIQKLEALLIRGQRRVQRNPVKVLAEAGQRLPQHGEDEEEDEEVLA